MRVAATRLRAPLRVHPDDAFAAKRRRDARQTPLVVDETHRVRGKVQRQVSTDGARGTVRHVRPERRIVCRRVYASTEDGVVSQSPHERAMRRVLPRESLGDVPPPIRAQASQSGLLPPFRFLREVRGEAHSTHGARGAFGSSEPARTGAGVRFPKRVASAGTSTEVRVASFAREARGDGVREGAVADVVEGIEGGGGGEDIEGKVSRE